jgi:divalent metal cation (Fe/Co/Zn/Cd) transporter
MTENNIKLYKQAYYLALVTIFYNILEGAVSVFLGYQDDTLTLFGFGVDSFIEVISGLGIAIMIIRIRRNNIIAGKFEKQALIITGLSFYLLSAGLLAGIIVNIMTRHKPESTFWGVVISLISIAVMLWLILSKLKIGKKLNSAPIIADANCSKVCLYMSLVLLVSSLIYELTGFAYADVAGAGGLIYFSFMEGREAFEKIHSENETCCQD